MSSNTVGGYSDFFKSGFRAFTSRAPGQAASCQNHLPPDVMLHPASLMPKTTSDATKRRPRPVSMIVQNTPREKARRRRTSFMSFTSQLFDRKSTSSSFHEKSTVSSPRSSTTSHTFDSGDSLPEVWITAGGPYTLSPSVNASSDEVSLKRHVDPIYSSPNPKSTLVDLSQDDSGPDISKRDSFLSFTSSSNRSSIIFTWSERPISIQTIPSQRSSLQYHHHHPSQEKSDFSWAVEEEEDDLLLSSMPVVDYEDRDAPAEIDWRQFHVDVLTDDM